MSSSSLTKKEAQQQQVQQQKQDARDVETQEHHASANASAGLNLNILGALSGAFSSKSKKTTHQNADGSSHTVEDKHDKGVANGVAQGQGNAFAAANAQEHSLKAKERGVGQEATQAKTLKGKKEEVNHLGLEN
ncbi:uncharacterized protein K460DRAFT_400300 [Cucurbitaria berberidis CBS 394.84]|uniref:Uncharacterized protein n=1 Tax=Cucurbitaria berberidis CBS 394.84 TaxID=1168544 RepID=A0A9P4GRT0_9PLEO|nr:uncharacterized protein K460DRAFT_400300 [Cucurbitaria berberidis CBS 394.84]KAF1850231.1 hypothetical protein K460DRAFT_400300 [Cucurbitaria berberidis CBS 394.84]